LVKIADDFKRWVTLVWRGILSKIFGIVTMKNTGIA
jgi:hypothetical protein